VRFWIGSDGALRGQLLNPVTHQVFTFASIAGLHEVLNRVVQGDLDGNEEPES
jgi:nickel-dependent lactate racemase